MSAHPATRRLVLRPLMLGDKRPFVTLLNDYDVAKNLGRVAHPYSDALFREFLTITHRQWEDGVGYTLAVTRALDGAFIGLCGVNRRDEGAWELGYWFGKPYWRQGYATEAAKAVSRCAFDRLGAERLTSGWFFDNPASGHVLEKLGFQATGTEEVNCVSRAAPVLSHRVELTRADFLRKKAA
jgi:RimJ/RimL family protein N-acetyltransferase